MSITLADKIPSLFRIGFKRHASPTIRASEQGVWAQIIGPIYGLAEPCRVADLIKTITDQKETIFEHERKAINLQRIAQEQADQHFLLCRYMTERGNMKNYRQWYNANAEGIMRKENAKRRELDPKGQASTSIQVIS